MAIPAFDTYVAAKTLRTAGFDEKQTEAAVTVIREAVAETSATKEGQDRLQVDIERLQAGQDRLQADLERLQADLERLQADLDKLRAEMQSGRAELRAEMKEGQDRLQAGLDRLQADQDRLRAEMKEGQDRLQAGHDRLQADLDKLRAEMVTKADLQIYLEASEDRTRSRWRADMLGMVLAFTAIMLTGFGAIVALV